MSGYLAGKVWRSALPGRIKPLAACLADFANHDGSGIYPSVEYLMWLLDSGETTIRTQMSELRQTGVLEPIKNDKGGRGKVPVYRMVEENLPRRPDFREFQKGSEIEPYSVKGSENDAKRVQISSLKGSNSDGAYKEDPSVEPSDDPSSETLFPSSEGSPSSDEEIVQTVWEYYREKIKKTHAVFTSERKRMGLARFHEAVKQLKGDRNAAKEWMEIAVDELAASDFHNARGKYEGSTKYNDWEHLFRSWAKFEKWLNRSNGL